MKRNNIFSIKFLLGISVLLFVLSCEKESKNIPAKDFYLPAKQTGYIPDNLDNIPEDKTKPCNSCSLDNVDLTPYLPPVGNQGETGTCVAWAVGYYMKTTLDAIAKNIKTAQHNKGTVYSPKDLFFSIPLDKRGDEEGNECNGTQFEHAFKVLTERGIATLNVVPFEPGDCTEKPAQTWDQDANKHKIKSVNYISPQNPDFLALVKQRLSENKPLVFGAFVSQSFKDWTDDEVMTESNLELNHGKGGHAMTIVGYDKNKNAFRIVNSWNVTWGDNGFAWISYDLMKNKDFCFAVFVPY